MERKNKQSAEKMGAWKDQQRKAIADERALLAEVAAETARVHSLN
jgi:hypothetical protein